MMMTCNSRTAACSLEFLQRFVSGKNVKSPDPDMIDVLLLLLQTQLLVIPMIELQLLLVNHNVVEVMMVVDVVMLVLHRYTSGAAAVTAALSLVVVLPLLLRLGS
jgi:hypothetical protein